MEHKFAPATLARPGARHGRLSPMQGDSVKLCECGCGRPAPIAEKTRSARGQVKGEPQRFVRGHATRGRVSKVGPQYAVDESTGCWMWQHTTSMYGYGLIWIAGRQWRAHRWFYLQRHGSVPPLLDHICRNKACVNPDHLRPATPAENNQNVVARRNGRLGASQQGRRWHAQVRHDGRRYYLGMYDTEDEAGDAVAAFRAKHKPFSPEARER